MSVLVKFDGYSLKEPCANCAAPYGFRNVMTLSQNTSQFAVSLVFKRRNDAWDFKLN